MNTFYDCSLIQVFDLDIKKFQKKLKYLKKKAKIRLIKLTFKNNELIKKTGFCKNA